jgi:hypothetical protein
VRKRKSKRGDLCFNKTYVDYLAKGDDFMKRIFLISSVVLLLIASAADAQINLTGRWNCDDGGKYYVRQLGNAVWWYGESGDNGATWTNVFNGTVQGMQINGSWADVPHGRITSSGTMTLQIQDVNHFRATSKTGGFGGNAWTREGSSPPPSSINLTGRWKCNDNGTYYLRQLGEELWWVGKSVDDGVTFTNVYRGKVQGMNVAGSWADVPHGNILGSGTMNLQIADPNLFRSGQKTGGFGGSEWTRIP